MFIFGKNTIFMLHIVISCIVALLSITAHADWVQAEGSDIFPATVAEAEACANADQRARTDAITKVTGETIAAETIQRCTDQGDDVQCTQNAAIWSTLGGTIIQTRNREQETLVEAESYRRCIVRFQADVKLSHGNPDPNFTLGLVVNAAIYRPGDAMVLRLNPSQPMYVQIFQWLPYEKADAQIVRLFPNRFDQNAQITQPIPIPSPAQAARYDLTLAFPASVPAGQKMVDEYVMAVATRTPVAFRASYTLDDFQKSLAVLPRQDSRIERRAYTIIRGTE